MRISLNVGTGLRPLNGLLFVVVYLFVLTGVYGQSPNGSYVAAFRTSKHVMASKPEVFHDAVGEVVRYLDERKVDLVSDPLRPRIETQDAISIDSLVKIAKQAGASYLLYIIDVSHLFPEVIAKDPIAVPQQVAQELVKRKCLPQLLPRPLRGWVGGYIEVENATPVMFLVLAHKGPGSGSWAP